MDLRVPNMTLLGKPTIEIKLNTSSQAHGDYVTSYSTMDKIEGTVLITPKNDTRFDDVEIAFIGTSKTFVDKLSSTSSIGGRTEASHQFLKLTQPTDHTILPHPPIAKGGETYKFSFTFVVPRQLLPKSCPHKTTNSAVKDLHLQVPPSLGDAEVSGFGGCLLDDLAPQMAKITYAIRATVLKNRESDGIESVLAQQSRKIRIKPAFEEHPPVTTEDKTDDYVLREEKCIRKGMFKGKLGRLVMESFQPRSLCLPASNPTANITTTLRVNLRFDPAEESSQPPTLGSLNSKFKATTFYASYPVSGLPSKSRSLPNMSQSFHSETLPLSTRCMASVQWTRHSGNKNSPSTSPTLSHATPMTPERRDSILSTSSTNSSSSPSSSTPAPSSAYAGASYYTAHLVVPVTLPHTKHFVPTFHSCLVSRIYALSLHLSLSSSSSTASLTPTLSLRVPVQISAEGSATSLDARRASDMEQEADEALRPRSVAPPPFSFVDSNSYPLSPPLSPSGGGVRHESAPPGYEVFPPTNPFSAAYQAQAQRTDRGFPTAARRRTEGVDVGIRTNFELGTRA
ncbi:hypothetical protein K402DRAFT_334260 [Aulographum hederae CBS 113979]|uniref:Arrestin-like N-terminal domain-containing protein n=1 Tax=Aulographum hederae CBS 113979 TaxID=1176131 RepID=A0A6G1GXC3_9PEZI|nr:hypothetical protein K402DRAFT_334260 [Aulographum hederae CBS 113979]